MASHTVVKPRQPLTVIPPLDNHIIDTQDDENITVEKFLEMQFQIILDEFKQHSTGLISKLRSEYEDGAKAIKDMMCSNLTDKKRLCLTLKCIAGPHIGQKFRLEPSNEDGDDIFKMGRSTGKLFREKGVSLYKDKEISTTHAKIEMKNGQIFLIDSKSTNGTLLNNDEVKALNPIRLKSGDIVTMGSTELMVHIADCDTMIENAENDPLC